MRNHIFNRIRCPEDEDQKLEHYEELGAIADQFGRVEALLTNLKEPYQRLFSCIQSVCPRQCVVAGRKLAKVAALLTLFEVKPNGTQCVDTRMLLLLAEKMEEYCWLRPDATWKSMKNHF